MITYQAEILHAVKNRPGTWDSFQVGVYRCEGESRQLVGQYLRNYSLLRTFFHFKKEDKDYALYSPDYTATRIMELPSCKDVGGEEPHSTGFCPVDFFVPRYIEIESIDLKDKARRHRVNQPSAKDLAPQAFKYTPLDEKTGQRITVEKPVYPVSPLTYYPFGFVAGCVWGDDSSWKIQFLDLSQADKGIVKRDDRFGYIAMPDSMKLEDAIDIRAYQAPPEESWSHNITIVIQKQFDLRTGKPVNDLA